MEIDIPDLDDVKFEELCRLCSGNKVYSTWEDGKVETPCTACDADGMAVTVVGQKLLDFLQRRGVSFNV